MLVLGLVGQASLAAGAQPMNVSRLHCGDHKFAHSIKISGPSNEIHGSSCDTAKDMIDKGHLSDSRPREFSSPGWGCGRGNGFEAYTYYCSRNRLLVEFHL